MASKWLNNKPKMKIFQGIRPKPHLQLPSNPPAIRELAALREILFSPVTQIFLISTTDYN